MDEELDADVRKLDNHIAALMEHFDTVQILCTRYDSKDKSTTQVSRGAGNWYARTGQMQEFLLKADTETQETIARQMDNGE